MKKNKSTFVKLLKRIKKHSFFIILSLIMAAVTVATTLYVPILVGRGIDCIIGVDNVAMVVSQSCSGSISPRPLYL